MREIRLLLCAVGRQAQKLVCYAAVLLVRAQQPSGSCGFSPREQLLQFGEQKG